MKRLLLSAALCLASTSALAIEPFSLPWVNNPVRDTMYNTEDHPNGVFVLEFSANFCSACNANVPNVNALAQVYEAEPRVQVLDMLIDQNDNEIARWIARHKPTRPVLKDVGRQVWNQIDARYIPTALIMDCHGDVHYQHTGSWTSSVRNEMRRVIDGLLSETCE